MHSLIMILIEFYAVVSAVVIIIIIIFSNYSKELENQDSRF